MEKAVDCLRMMVTFLVEKPEGIQIKETNDEMGVLFTLSVAQEDMGKVIGRAGNTAKAIRGIIRAVGIKNGARVSLKIDDPAETGYARPRTDKTLDESLEGLE